MLPYTPSRFVCMATRALALLWSFLLIRAIGPMTEHCLFPSNSFFA